MNYFKIFIISVLTLIITVSCSHVVAPYNPQPERSRQLVVVQTESGKVAGFRLENSLDVFLGIPYAEPPVGDLRYASPEPVKKWEYVKPALSFGPSCPQQPDEYEPSSLLYQDEDCLSLNIWTPDADNGKRPVLVYIHGGGFVAGGSGDPLYNGQYLAKRGGIVVASINYRLAELGFLALDSFGKEFAGSGNLALQDQIAGLTWIKNNITQFGGDPDNITIMGESAGSTCVSFLMISPKAKGLFKKAIAHSGTINLSRTREQAQETTRRFMKLAGVNDVKGLRSIPASKMVDLENKFIDEAGFAADLLFCPVLDDVIIPSDPVKAFNDGAAAGIPLLNGTNLDEYRYWLLYFGALKYIPPKMLLSYTPDIREKLGGNLDTIIDYYRDSTPGYFNKGIVFLLASDLMFRVPHIRLSDIQSAHAPVWMYRFDWKSQVSKDLGACHAIELPFVFRTFDSPLRYQVVGPNPPMELSDTMMDAWIEFVRSSNPNHSGMADWPAYNAKRRATMIFNEISMAKDNPDDAIYQLYKGILY